MREILEKIGVAFAENEPLARHTSFKIGGPADYFAEPASSYELAALLEELKANKMPFFIMGNGSNVLVPDEGLRLSLIHIYMCIRDRNISAHGMYALMCRTRMRKTCAGLC